MRNVTVTLDEQTYRWARVEAARRDLSLSAFLRACLESESEEARDYAAAYERWRRIPSFPKGPDGGRWMTREEIYERPGRGDVR